MNDDARPSLLRRLLAAVVLVIVAVIAIQLVIGAIKAIFWFVALVVLVVAALWAWATLRSGGGRDRGRGRDRGVKPTSTGGSVAPAAYEDRVEAQMREIQEQLRKQGRG
jgi:hypothetical protein